MLHGLHSKKKVLAILQLLLIECKDDACGETVSRQCIAKGFSYRVFSQVTNLKIKKHSSSLENNLQEHVFEIFDGSFLKILHICCRRMPKIQILTGTATFFYEKQ